jgi:hypothetical protein
MKGRPCLNIHACRFLKAWRVRGVELYSDGESRPHQCYCGLCQCSVPDLAEMKYVDSIFVRMFPDEVCWDMATIQLAKKSEMQLLQYFSLILGFG